MLHMDNQIIPKMNYECAVVIISTNEDNEKKYNFP